MSRCLRLLSLLLLSVASLRCGADAQPGGTGNVTLALSTITATSITQTTAVITWSTNESSTSTVQYGLTASYGSATPLYGLTLTHQVELMGLTPGTTYHYAVTSSAGSSEVTSQDFTFTTLGGGSHDGGAPGHDGGASGHDAGTPDAGGMAHDAGGGEVDSGTPGNCTATGTLYYVSGTGSDNNTGRSASSAFATLSKAAGLTNPGDTVCVMNGTYTNPCSGCDVMDITRSGTAAAPITYQAAPGQKPLVQFSGSWLGFNIQASYITIDGFEVEGLDEAMLTQSQALALGEGSPRPNATCIGAGAANLSAPLKHLVIKNNTVHGCSESGIGIMSSDYVTLDHNVSYDNSWWSQYGGSGISLAFLFDSDSNTGYKNFVTGNISYANQMKVGEPAAGGTMADGNGIIIDDNENDQSGHPAYGGRTLVENNLVYLNGGTGMHAFHSQHVDFAYNTAYMNNQSSDNANGQISGIEVNDVNIVDNILYGVGSLKPVSMTGSNTNFTFDYNVLFNGSVSVTSAHDVVADPLFVNAGTDFHLKAGSPAIDSASATFAPTTDLDGNPRPVGSGYDRGCYEYQ